MTEFQEEIGFVLSQSLSEIGNVKRPNDLTLIAGQAISESSPHKNIELVPVKEEKGERSD